MEKPKHRSMETITTIQNISGSWYIRIPPEFAKHLNLQKDERIEARIRTEINQKQQNYCSIWKNGS